MCDGVCVKHVWAFEDVCFGLVSEKKNHVLYNGRRSQIGPAGRRLNELYSAWAHLSQTRKSAKTTYRLASSASMPRLDMRKGSDDHASNRGN